MRRPDPLAISALLEDRTKVAIGLLARAFVADPLHEVTFGGGRLDRNEGFFRVALASMKGTKVVATEHDKLLGVAHWVLSPRCQYPVLEQAMTLPRLIRAVGIAPALKVIVWLSSWAKHDPSVPHSHLGPIAVEPEAQGRGIGTQMMQLYCKELEQAGVMGFLETDKPGNVSFYERFGFEVTARQTILGVENWFMRRPAP